MKIVETVCGNCGAKDTLFPLEDGTRLWKCGSCGEVFEEENENTG
jgi:rubredoxin